MKRREFIYTTTTIVGSLLLGCSCHFNKQIKPIRIGLITDLHYANRRPNFTNNRYYNESLNKLSECISIMNEKKVDFLIELGDFKDQDDFPNEEKTLKYLTEIENEFRRFNGPIFHVLGNHDHDSISKQQFLDNVTNSNFKKAKNYYSFNKNGFHFIVLDANYTSNGCEYDHGNFDWKDSFVPEKQINWLKKDLDLNKNPSVVFIHQRLDKKEGNENYCVKNANAIQNIFDKHGNVILVLQGHDHRGDLSIIKDIVYYTLKAAIEGSGPTNNNYAILDINQDLEMKLIGFRKTRSQVFTNL